MNVTMVMLTMMSVLPEGEGGGGGGTDDADADNNEDVARERSS